MDERQIRELADRLRTFLGGGSFYTFERVIFEYLKREGLLADPNMKAPITTLTRI